MQNIKHHTRKGLIVFSTLLVAMILLACTACAPRPSDQSTQDQSTSESASDSSSQVSAPQGMAVEFTMESDCGMCHASVVEAEQNSETTASVHASHDTTCTSCHDQESDLAEAHAGATMGGAEPKRLKKAKMAESACLSCHESYEALAEKTTEATELTDKNGLTINPHSAKQLNLEHEEEITCTNCHTEHDVQKGEKSQAFCMNCHHSKAYECNTCHEAS